MSIPYIIFPLGDCAATIELGKEMNEGLNKKVLAIQKWLDNNRWAGFKDCVVAYSTVTVYYDPTLIRRHCGTGTSYSWIEKKLELAYAQSGDDENGSDLLTRIPVCYDEEFGTDLEHVRNSKGLSTDQIIALHTSRSYRIYMLGFLPGFAYMGETDPALNLPRKEVPEQVLAGSVGIVSNQTGIYPVDSPGGWYIIGKTPLKLFEADAQIPVRFAAGEQLQFYQISREEFDRQSNTTKFENRLSN